MRYNVTAWGQDFGPETLELSQDRVDYLLFGFEDIFGSENIDRRDGADESITVSTRDGSAGMICIPLTDE